MSTTDITPTPNSEGNSQSETASSLQVELVDTCKAASRGDLSHRIVGIASGDPLAPVAHAVNALLDRVEASQREATAALAAAVERRFHREFIARGMTGSFRAMAERINDSMASMADADAQMERLKEERKELAEDFRSGVLSMATTLAGASTELDATAATLSESSGQTVMQVERGSEAADAAVANIHAVASATEQLSASISEIAKQAECSTESTRSATSEARAAGEVMSTLAAAAEGVDGIVEVISDVARQTNLLALNAAIEAARAGEAGRGFGVVASEVKQLANQTARSTQDIASRIEAMRAATTDGVQSIRRIGQALEEAEGFASTISAAIYQQETATQHIAQNAEQATLAARTVAGELEGIKNHAESARHGSHDIQESAGDISRQSERLTSEVDSFLNRMSE